MEQLVVGECEDEPEKGEELRGCLLVERGGVDEARRGK